MEDLSLDFTEIVAFLTAKRSRVPVMIFLLLCLNVLLAPAVQAATPEASRYTSYAIACLGAITVGLCVYLFVVIFQPERF
ncbi:MAG: K(+)-transporting ATPase subunit F [Goleter apudmare HA4340-LM2]|jgi:K+-transporting ATPase KdpF subunit|nr:K(+)-transporting ATPase subunit F [Goleter apudmare HA4340-LM2]